MSSRLYSLGGCIHSEQRTKAVRSTTASLASICSPSSSSSSLPSASSSSPSPPLPSSFPSSSCMLVSSPSFLLVTRRYALSKPTTATTRTSDNQAANRGLSSPHEKEMRD